MNTMLADSLEWIAEKLEVELAKDSDKAAAVFAVLQELMQLHGNVVFGGDGYSAEWHKAAVEERGLQNIPTTADALPAFKSPEVIELFAKTGVLTPVELASRFEVYAEQYVLSIEVEAKLVSEMATTIIYPAAINYLSSIASTGIKLDYSPAGAVAETASAMMASVEKLNAALESEHFDSTEAHMSFLADEVRGLMDEVRAAADKLETLVADDLWPLPKYREMLFIK
jgi:glutamine synthetase